MQEIADQFGIHPNVARLHLTKLNETKLITSELRKQQKRWSTSEYIYRCRTTNPVKFSKTRKSLLLVAIRVSGNNGYRSA